MPIGNLRNQDVTYWTQAGLSGDGFHTFNTPVTVKGRWEDREVLINNGELNEVLSSNSRVHLAVDLKQGDFVYLGTSVSATPEATARKVVRVVQIPSVDGRVTERTYYLD